MVEAKVDTDKKIFFIILLVSLIGGIFGTYSYFSSKSESEEQTINTATLSLDFDDSTPIVNSTNIIPINDDMIFDKAVKKDFKIINTSNIAAVAKLELNITNIDKELKSPDFKWALYNGQKKVNEGNFSELTSNTLELTNNVDILNEVSYTLYIWIHNTNAPQDLLQNKNLTANLSVSAVQA